MRTIKLRDIASPISINISNPSDCGYDKFVGLEHYDSGEFVISRYSGVKLLTSAAKEFKKNDILIARRNVYLKRAGIVKFDGITSGDSIILRVNDHTVDTVGVPREIIEDYLPLVLNTEDFWLYANKHADGMNSKRISKDTLLDYEFMLPSEIEIKNISEKAWAAYRLKEAYKRLLVATDEMVKSQFIEMFGNPDTPIAKGHDLFTFASGKSMVKSELSNEYPYDCYGGNGITGKARDFLVANTTIVIGRVGEYCGCVHKTTEKSWITDNAIYVKSHSNKMLLDFAFHAFIIADFHRFATESGQPKITQEPLLSYEFPVPSIEEQEVFINIVRQADKSKFELKRAIEAIDKVIKSLING